MGLDCLGHSLTTTIELGQGVGLRCLGSCTFQVKRLVITASSNGGQNKRSEAPAAGACLVLSRVQ